MVAAKTKIAVLSACLATAIALVYWLSRLGFSNPPGPILKVLFLSYFLLFLPVLVRLILTRYAAERSEHWIFSHGVLSISTLFLLVVAGKASQMIGLSIWAPFALAGGALFAGFAFFQLMKSSWKAKIFAVVWIALLSLWIMGAAWGQNIQSPWFLENLVVDKADSRIADPLYHSSIAAMIKTHDMPSTGLNGIPFVPYHFGSHAVFANLSSLLRLDVLTFYQLGFQVIFIPFLVMAILCFVDDLRSRRSDGGESTGSFWGLAAVLSIFAVGFVGFMPGALRDLAWMGSHLVTSESYSLATAFFFLLASILMTMHKQTDTLGLPEKAFLLVALPLLLAFLGLLKVSTMLMAVAIYGYLIFRLGLLRRWPVALSFAVVAVLTILVVPMTTQHDSNQGIVPFAYIVSDLIPKLPGYHWLLVGSGFVIFNLFFSWLYVALRLRRGVSGGLSQAIRQGAFLDVEVLLLVALAGLLPGLLMEIPGMSALFFSDIQRWLAIALLLGLIPAYPLAGARVRELFSGRRAIRNIALTGAVLALLPGLYGHVKASVDLFMFRNTAVRAAAAGEGKDRNLQVLSALVRLRQMPAKEKERTLVYIPKSNTAYWQMQPGVKERKALSFIAPAITEMAMIDHLPEERSDAINYGYEVYYSGETARLGQGFTRVIELRADRAREMSIEQWMNSRR